MCAKFVPQFVDIWEKKSLHASGFPCGCSGSSPPVRVVAVFHLGPPTLAGFGHECTVDLKLKWPERALVVVVVVDVGGRETWWEIPRSGHRPLSHHRPTMTTPKKSHDMGRRERLGGDQRDVNRTMHHQRFVLS
jgi:hypothetical protein